MSRRSPISFAGWALTTRRSRRGGAPLKRLLASQSLTFTDLGDAIEKLATGGLTQSGNEADLRRCLRQGRRGHERKHAEAQSVYGLRPDGSNGLGSDRAPLSTAQRPPRGQASSIRRRHGLAHDLGPRADSEKQGKYLLSLFRQIGGRIA